MENLTVKINYAAIDKKGDNREVLEYCSTEILCDKSTCKINETERQIFRTDATTLKCPGKQKCTLKLKDNIAEIEEKPVKDVYYLDDLEIDKEKIVKILEQIKSYEILPATPKGH